MSEVKRGDRKTKKRAHQCQKTSQPKGLEVSGTPKSGQLVDKLRQDSGNGVDVVNFGAATGGRNLNGNESNKSQEGEEAY